MDLKTFLSSMALQDRETFAVRCGVTLGHLLNCTSGSPATRKTCGPKVAVAIERESDGAVTRQELREDWRDCWPELATGPHGAVNRVRRTPPVRPPPGVGRQTRAVLPESPIDVAVEG